ncbi:MULTISPECIES: alpha/beta fold hydrolase [Tsukamurella]|uniref:Alpha/beta hydrolase n=2 Tax=Tsukamurella TaxID=2060 RepID=A0A5C5S094_9ACTN|nr:MULTISPECIES: alpha/beta fold hydrolase [Tsukamurella]NMD56056.1 alpha/beta hydrolase [Tsukamurella columbiensis]TWS28837.1 alpha/beta hydrolase [Tsukamurella conjunctivitidis]
MSHARPRALAAAGIAVGAFVAVSACAPVPAPTPDYVTDFGKGGAAPSGSGDAAAKGPEWRASAKDPLAWQDCTGRLATRYATPPAANATLQCATLTVGVGQTDAPLKLSVTRARVPGTPDTAAPLVLVGGTEFTGQRALATLAAGDSPVLANRPVVAVERRGIGTSGALTCRTEPDQAILRSGGGPGGSPETRVAKIGEAAQRASTSCGDAYADAISDFTAASAAEDLEKLRTTWDVPALGLLAVGDGSTTALAYAAQHPKQVARLVLDSPVRYGGTEVQRAEDAARGTSATVDAFAAQCGPTCALGADPAGAMRTIIDDAAAGRLGGFTDTDVRRAVVVTLGVGPGDRDARITRLATALQGARTGDAAPLRALLRTADEALGSDGQFIARCSDAVTKASPDQILASVRSWGPEYRLGGATALELGTCSAWPTMAAPPKLTDLGVKSVVATSAADPLTARTALDTLTGQLTVVGARPTTITWAGLGDGAVVRSSCVQKSLVGYLDRLDAPATQACPA